MLRLLMNAIFPPESKRASRFDPRGTVVTAAIEKAVDGTDARLRALPRYQDKLREAVVRAVEFADGLGDGFAAPLELGGASLGSDPRARGFFSSAARVREVFGTSPEVQQFLREPRHRALGRLHAGLATRLNERTVLAPALRGDRIQQEVKRTLVSFDEHRVVLPAEDEAHVRWRLKERAFVTLVECALERLTQREGRKQDLEKQRALLRAKLGAMRSAHCGLGALAGDADAAPDAGVVEQALDKVQRALGEVSASGGVLERNLDDVRDVLCQPEAFIRRSSASRRLTPMGYLALDDEPQDEVEFEQIEIRGRPIVTGVLVSFPVADVEAAEVYADRMRRALGAPPTGLDRTL